MFFRTDLQLARILNAVEKVYHSSRWSNGFFVETVGDALKRDFFMSSVDKVLPTTNGTEALRVALLSIPDLRTVIVPDLTASPVWVAAESVHPSSLLFYNVEDEWNADLTQIEDLLKKSQGSGNVALIIVHVGGLVNINVQGARELCDQYNVTLIEDVSHSQRCISNGIVAGQWGHLVIGSLYATKAFTCGEGGYVGVSKNPLVSVDDIYRVWNVGKNQAEEQLSLVGTNARMSEFQAAILFEILHDVTSIQATREAEARIFDSVISSKIYIPQRDRPMKQSTYYKYIVMGDAQWIAQVDKRLSELNFTAKTSKVFSSYYPTPIFDSYGQDPLRLVNRHVCLNLSLPIEQKKIVGSLLSEV